MKRFSCFESDLPSATRDYAHSHILHDSHENHLKFSYALKKDVSRITEYVKSFQNRNSHESSAAKQKVEKASVIAEVSHSKLTGDMPSMSLKLSRFIKMVSDSAQSKNISFNKLSLKAISIIHYAAKGSAFRCILDGNQITDKPVKIGICEDEGGFQITFTAGNYAPPMPERTNNYRALGSVLPCILDAFGTLKNHIKTDSCASEGVI